MLGNSRNFGRGYVKTEQRQHARYRIRGADFNIFSRGTQITGQLVNVSKAGLAFQFAPGPGKTTECRAIDISGPMPDRFYISGITCRSIYDIGVLAKGRTFSGAETGNCGVQFLNLDGERNQALMEFLSGFAVSR